MRVRHRKEGERTQWPPTRYVPLLSVRECQGQPHSNSGHLVLDYVSRCLISLRREELPVPIHFFSFFYFTLFFWNLEEATIWKEKEEEEFARFLYWFWFRRQRGSNWNTFVLIVIDRFLIFKCFPLKKLTRVFFYNFCLHYCLHNNNNDKRSKVYKLRGSYRLYSGLIFVRARNRWSFRCSSLLKIIFDCAPEVLRRPETLPAFYRRTCNALSLSKRLIPDVHFSSANIVE